MAIVYMTGRRFICWYCGRVAYSSQSVNACGRAWRRHAKPEAKLGDNWRRPKGMHRATYVRVLDRIDACENVRDQALAAYLATHMHLFP